MRGPPSSIPIPISPRRLPCLTCSYLGNLPPHPSTTESRIVLRSSKWECGSPAAAFLSDSYDSIPGDAQSCPKKNTSESVRQSSNYVATGRETPGPPNSLNHRQH